MENLHAPTVPSGPTSGAGPDGSKTAGLSLAELQVKKDNMEAELKALSSVLDSVRSKDDLLCLEANSPQHGVNMNTPLTTPDGFPRADLDVAQVRTTRSRIIYLKNDYKALMDIIEKRIHEHFANNIPIPTPPPASSNSTSTTVLRQAPLDAPFAKVNSVVQGSPADTAGLKAGDEIRNFGYVNKANNDGLKRVADCVQGNEGVSRARTRSDTANIPKHNILVKVSRTSPSGGRDELQLTLTPRKDWGGRGMLGCHILPI